jgi:putative ABC transport system ATP-binding protein
VEIAKDADRGVLVVTHDPRLVPYADRIIHIEDGNIVREQSRNGAQTLKEILERA